MDEAFTTKAIVLSRRPYRENDSKIIAYSLEYGKLSLIARGTGSIRSKMAGHIEPFCLSDFMIVRGRRCDYIGGVASTDCFSNIKSDLLKLEIAGQACAVFNRLIKEKETDKDLFFILNDYLEFLDKNIFKQELGDLLLHIFILKLLVILGYEPELYACVACGKAIGPDGSHFDPGRGGLVCSLCKGGSGLAISGDAIKLLRYIIKKQFADILKLQIDNKVSALAIKNIILFYNYHFNH